MSALRDVIHETLAYLGYEFLARDPEFEAAIAHAVDACGFPETERQRLDRAGFNSPPDEGGQ